MLKKLARALSEPKILAIVALSIALPVIGYTHGPRIVEAAFVGTATGPLDMKGEDLVLGDDDCMFHRAAENTYAWRCGSVSDEFYLDTFGITFGGAAGRINMGAQPVFSTSGILALGGSMTSTQGYETGAVGTSSHLEIDGELALDSGVFYFAETTAPTPIANYGSLHTTSADVLIFTDGAGVPHTIGGRPTFAYSTHPASSSGGQYTDGFYAWSATDANLSDGGPTTVTHGAANNAHGARAGLVAGGPGSVDAGSASIVVSGTSFDVTTGTRTPADSEIIVADITTMALNDHYQTTKRWLGIITYTITPAGAATYSADFNYGMSDFNQFAGYDFTLTSFRAMYHGNSNETDLSFTLYHHSDAGWTYAATGFVAGGVPVIDAGTDLGVDDNLDTGELGAFERRGLSTFVNGDDGEGFIVRFDTAVNNSMHHLNIRVGANL